MKVCPICGKPYKGYSAISRKDCTTEICPDCGLDEAIKCFINANVKGKEKSK